MNQKKAIKYVKKNSSHPHSVMIVEWLLSDKEIEFYDDTYRKWVDCGKYITWCKDVQYRFKPEIATKLGELK